MNEKPIIFNADMVRAVLDGRKTQTRRPINPDHIMEDDIGNGKKGLFFKMPSGGWSLGGYESPYGKPGDRLWVKEKWNDSFKRTETMNGCTYLADYGHQPSLIEYETAKYQLSWRPPSKMPRWASRITLEIKSVRVERVWEIQPRDAWAEGCKCSCTQPVPECHGNIDSFLSLWDSIYDSKGFGWSDNPWVWVIEFERLKEKQMTTNEATGLRGGE